MLHKNISPADNHAVYTWAVADSTARLALSVVAADVGKVCWQQDTDTMYVLKDDSPMTWIQVGVASSLSQLSDWPSAVSATEVGYLDGVTSGIQTQLGNKQNTSEKNQINGYAGLDGTGKVAAAQLPSYTDYLSPFLLMGA